MGSLSVLNIAYPFARVGPGSVGGAEEIVASLDEALTARGWNSIVIAHAASRITGRLLGIPVPQGIIGDGIRGEVERLVQEQIDHALRSFQVDVVHMHGFDFCRYHLPVDVPVLVTLHLPPSWYPKRIWSLPANYQLQCVSRTQRTACPEHVRSQLAVIENGVRLYRALVAPRRRFALMLSRICPEKNLHVGFDAAALAKVPILLAGSVFPYEDHLRYFEEKIRPRLRRGQARLLHPVSREQRTILLSRASCLLLPTLAPETSSLVAMEAAAAGTPVCAFASGAIAEIVVHGRTGFLVDSTEQMADAIRRAPEIDSSVCRVEAASRFSLESMIDKYIGCYTALARGALPLADSFDPLVRA